MNNLFKGAALFIGGALVGAVAALLVTPKTGEEIRKQIADLAEETKDSVKDYCEQLKNDISAACKAEEPKAEEPKAEEPKAAKA